MSLTLLFYVTGLQRPPLPSGQLLEQTCLLSQGVTAVFCGSSQFVHWTTIWVKSKQLTPLPSRRVSRVKENKPDFILEYFIVHSAYSGNGSKEPCKMHNKQVLQTCFIILLQLQYITKRSRVPRRVSVRRLPKYSELPSTS